MAKDTEAIDSKGLIKDSYLIDGISAPECRSIFLDWALSVPETSQTVEFVSALLDRYRPSFPDHPMTRILEDALLPAERSVRRGGSKGRRSGQDE